MSKKKIVKDWNMFFTPVNPDDLWESDWEIRLKNDTKDYIGKCSFAGEKFHGTIPFYIEIEPLYRDKNYATDAIRCMTEWAFSFRNILEVKVTIEHENSAAVAAFQKAGFVYRSGTKEIEHYSITKQKTTWTGLYAIIGIVIGMGLGILFSSLWVGFVIGLLGCILTGAKMDYNVKKEREEILGHKEQKNSYRNLVKNKKSED